MTQIEVQDFSELTDALEECQIYEKKPSSVVLNDACISTIEEKFPKPRPRVPPIFLHKPVKFTPLIRKVLNLGIKFYCPLIGHNYTKISCQTLDDHRALIQYFKNKQLPYHTFGYPDNRKLKVVFRGLPKYVDLDNFRKELELVSIPIVRVHTMNNKESAMDQPLLVLVVVPDDDEGRKILRVQKFLDHHIEIEPLKSRCIQCHRCQKWGHAQRYCNGHVKCVKCGGDHFYQKCTRNPAELPPKCANCGSNHTSSYKLCPFSPTSPQYEKKLLASAITKHIFPNVRALPKKLITLNNCHLFLRDRV